MKSKRFFSYTVKIWMCPSSVTVCKSKLENGNYCSSFQNKIGYRMNAFTRPSRWCTHYGNHYEDFNLKYQVDHFNADRNLWLILVQMIMKPHMAHISHFTQVHISVAFNKNKKKITDQVMFFLASKLLHDVLIWIESWFFYSFIQQTFFEFLPKHMFLHCFINPLTCIIITVTVQ